MKKIKAWTNQEIKILTLMYFNAPMEEILERLPGRSRADIRDKAALLRKRKVKFR